MPDPLSPDAAMIALAEAEMATARWQRAAIAQINAHVLARHEWCEAARMAIAEGRAVPPFTVAVPTDVGTPDPMPSLSGD